MGVHRLWPELLPAAAETCLLDVSPVHKTGWVGIDVSIWLYEAASLSAHNNEKRALQNVFFKCCALLRSPLTPLFVFDGPGRPHQKRRRSVRGTNTHWHTEPKILRDPFMGSLASNSLVFQAFGFGCLNAPGEAEAELAALQSQGVIDVIISDDIDALIFGASTVLVKHPNCSTSTNRKHNALGPYHMIQANKLVVQRDGLILVALLNGGDYDGKGEEGFGIKVSLALARCGFGETLVSNFRNLDLSRFHSEFLPFWRAEVLQELCTNSRGFMATKHPALAISASFPDISVLWCYVSPLTSSSEGVALCLTNLDTHPSIHQIAQVCKACCGWDASEIERRFRNLLWSGLVIRALRHAILME
ncbi:PIN domain-like protein, partial [Mycena floridula]